MTMQIHPLLTFIFSFSIIISCLPFLNVRSGSAASVRESPTRENNPFTPKASLIRYWNREIHTKLPKSAFLLSKASPLTAVDAAAFSKLAAANSLSTKLPAFCAAANLLCFPDLKPSLEKHDKDANFATYSDQNFTNYGTGRAGGQDSFSHYSDDNNIAFDNFRRYGRDTTGHDEKFSSYGPQDNVLDQSFNTYGTGATGGGGDFQKYNEMLNVPNLRFSTYSDDANGKAQSFKSYNSESNHGEESFASYGKKANGAPIDFSSYGEGSNVMGSGFSNYGETANGANDTFKTYGSNGNVPGNNFNNYGAGGNAGSDNFRAYSDGANIGSDTFQSYAKGSNSEKANFANYARSFNGALANFTSYGQSATGQLIGFKIYGKVSNFKEYAKKGVSFANYENATGSTTSAAASKKVSGSWVNKWVEPGKFFREKELKIGHVMPMPDIRDKMPKRSFLPQSITSKLPFASAKLGELKKIFHAGDNSSMEKMIAEALGECERAPSAGETKRCVGSAEEMIDFATSVLGRNVELRTTANVEGSKKKIMLGSVRAINGGEITKSVSCHQSLYPYLLYYCHSVPEVRVYEADILDPSSKAEINHGVAICHIDTSAWSPTHGAFLALGPGPGKIEVCHWIFENDLTWTLADE